MKLRLVFLFLAVLSPALVHASSEQTAPAEKPAVQMHPLTGVVVDVVVNRQALLVKHDEIPGVMRAMTMMFRVEAEVLETVKKGDAIKGLMGRDEHNRWILREVEVVAPAS
ncbi:MAG: copper-binding protein [Candidatus Didemnitutus sp.]|nr:copper-binding protein [Candidatus Didemnitutus sp.]